MKFTSEELTLIGTLTGAFIGGLFGFLTAWITKRSEERKSFNEAVMKVALEQHATQIEAAQKAGGGWVQPYSVYLVTTLQYAKIINKPFLYPKLIKRLLTRADKVIDATMEHVKERVNLKK